MEHEDPSITFDRMAGEHAMYRQLFGLLLANSPGAIAAVRMVTPQIARDLMEARPVSDVFVEQAIEALENIRERAEAAVKARDS